MSSQTSLDIDTASDQERVRRALVDGGRARVTIVSKQTGKHLTIRLACKRKDESGRYVSRARIIGRVGIEEADALFADGGDSALDTWIGTLRMDTGEWFTPSQWADPRGSQYFWAARRVVRWAMSGDEEFGEQAEVLLATECSYCGHGLEDPESITRGVGPECFGRATKSRHA